MQTFRRTTRRRRIIAAAVMLAVGVVGIVPWKLTAAMPRSLGGHDAGPDPGVLGRAAIASCLAIGYATWFARLDVSLNSVEVEVEADFDYGGVLGVSDVSAGYTELRYSVNVDSPASKREIVRVLDKADAHSPWLTNMKM